MRFKINAGNQPKVKGKRRLPPTDVINVENVDKPMSLLCVGVLLCVLCAFAADGIPSETIEMTTVRTISYEVSGELPYGPQGPTSYAGVQLDAGDPEELRRFLDQVTPGFGAPATYQPHPQPPPQQQPGNYFSPPPVTVSSRQAIAAEAATLGRARSLSPALQQRQQRETDYNYLRRNYQPTWVDTIDEIYNPLAAQLHHEAAAPRLACSYTRRYDDAPSSWQHQQLPQHELHGQAYGQDSYGRQQNDFESRQQGPVQQQVGQFCQHCPDRNGIQPPSDDSALEQRAVSLSPQKSYRFSYQSEQQNQHSQHHQQQQQQPSVGNLSGQRTIVTTVNGRTQSQPPASLLQYANVEHRKPGNAPSCTQCQNCGCHSAQPQQQNWQQDQRFVVRPETREQQHWHQQQHRQQSPQKQLIQHQTVHEDSQVGSDQHDHHQQQIQPPQHYEQQQQAHGQLQHHHIEVEFQQNVDQREPQQYDIVVQHDNNEQHRSSQQQQQQKQHHGIGYYQMLKQQQQQQTKGKPLLDSPIQKQQRQPEKQQSIQKTHQPQQQQQQQQQPQQHQQQQQQTYSIEHRQEYIPIKQQPVDQEHKQQHFTVNQQQFNQPEEPISKVYYPQQDYSHQQHSYQQQQPRQHNQQQIIYQQEDEQHKQHVHHHLQQQYEADVQHNYDINQQQQQRQPQQQQQQRQPQQQQQQTNKSTVSVGRPPYLGGKPKSNHLYFSPRGAAEDETAAPLTFTTAIGDGHPERLTVNYRQLTRRSQSENPRRNHSPVPGASERGYQYGGMDFVDHDGPLPFRPDDFAPDGSSPTAHTRKSRDELPLRRPGDHYGLDYSAHPAAASLSPTREDIEWYHGYAPRVPRQHWKFSADPDAPLNNYEVAIWDQVDPTGLVGDTLSNQKIASEPSLSEQEKNQFCVEFAPPVGFGPEHRTVIPAPTDPEPICMSLSANKDKLKNATSSTPDAHSQNQYRINTTVHTGHPLNSTEDSSWYSNGNKEVMRSEPNWSRNVVLRKQAWEGDTNGKEGTRPSWARNGHTQQQQQQQQQPLQHNEQQRMTRSAHWVKQQENEQKEQQPVKQQQQQQQTEIPQKSPQQGQPQQRYPKHPQQQYVNEWQLSQRDQYEQHNQQQQQQNGVEEQQQPDDNDVDVVIEEVEVDQVDFEQPNEQGQPERQIIFTRYQSGGEPSGDRQFIIQNKNPQQSKGQLVSRTQFSEDAKPTEQVNGNTPRQTGDGAGIRQQINRSEFVS